MLQPIEVQDGLRVTRDPRFSERSVREALLNAIAHRDYNDPESVLVRMSPSAFEATSPGPFPATITPDNVADEQFRRNRRLAEALEKCGRIERSGQGVDLMIEAAVRHGQELPTFTEPDGRAVRVVLHGDPDAQVLPALHRVAGDTWDRMGTADLRALDAVRRRVPRSAIPKASVRRLVELGVVEPAGAGDSPLSYASVLRGGAPSDAFGPSLVDVISALREAAEGVRYVDLRDTLDVDSDELRRILQWLRRNGLAYTTGRTRATKWHYVER